MLAGTRITIELYTLVPARVAVRKEQYIVWQHIGGIS